ncbi:uncharacterized protein LOC143027063 isoform X1 [Oratosquilla oratoria]|uniref:uncharacterized protein LOC143027063 isoform X1 n=1 Tax=Oratosquilla oratoria TaxID=337810 RepID=UPI003F775AE8
MSGNSSTKNTSKIYQEGSRLGYDVKSKQESYKYKYEPPPNIFVKKVKQHGFFGRWIRSNPVKFQVIALTLGLSLYFSRPLYDCFFREHFEGPLQVREGRKK